MVCHPFGTKPLTKPMLTYYLKTLITTHIFVTEMRIKCKKCKKATILFRRQLYNDVIMASQITSLMIVYSTVYLGAYQSKHESSASLAFVNSPWTGEFPAQMASNAENVSISWRHHEYTTMPMQQSVLDITSGIIWAFFYYVMSSWPKCYIRNYVLCAISCCIVPLYIESL